MSLFGNNSKPSKKPGFLETLFGAGNSSKRCDGDCRHCPPHYGYRYGRWYYGHDHTHGCERGGKKGSGGRDYKLWIGGKTINRRNSLLD